MAEKLEEEVPGLGVRLDGAVLRIRFQRPDKRNSLSREMLDHLIDRIEDAPDDERIRVIALSGEGDHFCSGIDLISINDPNLPRPRIGHIVRRVPREAHRLIPAMMDVHLPIVAAVRGWASGIGLHIALASDFVVASETARLWEPFVPRGFTPDSGGSYLLTRLVGLTRAKEMLLLGREVSGTQAAEWGLVHRAAPDAEVDAAAEALVQELSRAPTVAYGLTKWLLHRSLDHDLKHALENEGFGVELSSRSRDFKEGMQAFAQKRRPEYEGR